MRGRTCHGGGCSTWARGPRSRSPQRAEPRARPGCLWGSSTCCSKQMACQSMSPKFIAQCSRCRVHSWRWSLQGAAGRRWCPRTKGCSEVVGPAGSPPVAPSALPDDEIEDGRTASRYNSQTINSQGINLYLWASLGVSNPPLGCSSQTGPAGSQTCPPFRRACRRQDSEAQFHSSPVAYNGIVILLVRVEEASRCWEILHRTAMAEEDAPTLPPDFFERCSWNIHTDFHSLKEIGKGK